jgi:hypothetical protein
MSADTRKAFDMRDEPTTTAGTPTKVREMEHEAMRQYRAKYPDGIPWHELDSQTRTMWVVHVEGAASIRRAGKDL